jgi:hypothetical protein
MQFNYKNTLLALMAACSLSACEKVIDVDLNSTDPKFVIEAAVTDQLERHTVKITKSVNFDQESQYPAVTGAQVVLSDDAGLQETLIETSAGVYQTKQALQGVPGHTYTLRVEAEGKTFSAVSKMPALVLFEDMRADRLNFAGSESIAMVPTFNDPAGLGNYYWFVQTNNDTALTNIFVLDDRLSDGIRITRPLIAQELETAVGDSVVLEMRCIDKATYTYLYTLDASSGQGPNASTPANPDNNFGNACLGYFSAYTVQRKGLRVK